MNNLISKIMKGIEENFKLILGVFHLSILVKINLKVIIFEIKNL